MTIELPNDLPLERDVLGACLLRPDALMGLDLSDEDFAHPGHRDVWRAMLRLHADGERIDLVRLRSALADAGKLSAIGGEEGLTKLRYTMPPAELPTQRLRTMTKLRGIRRSAETAIACATAGDLDTTLASLAEAHNAALHGVRRAKTKNAMELCEGLLEELSGQRSGVLRIHPGYDLLEKHLGSVPVGCTVGVLAQTNVGKSSYTMEMLVRAAQRGVTCGYVSVEDQEPVVRARLMSMASGVSSRLILQHRLERGDFADITNGFGVIEKMKKNLLVSVLQGGTDGDACAAMADLAQRGCKMIAVDYLQKIQSSKEYKSRAHEMASTATRIVSQAQKLNVVGVLVSQCTREKNRLNECPSKHDMKESGDLENMLDALIGIWREYEDDFSPIWVRLLKVKWGGVGSSWRLTRSQSGSRLDEVEDSDREQPPDAKGEWSHQRRRQ